MRVSYAIVPALIFTVVLVCVVSVQVINNAVHPIALLFDLPILVIAVLSWFFVASGEGSQLRQSQALPYAARGALLFGLVAFVAGFAGPMIFTPHSNQGPLLGILITGPLGVVIGTIAGAIYGATRRGTPPPREGDRT